MPTSLSLSIELLLLMDWLLKKDQIKIKSLVEDAIKDGFLSKLEQIDEIENNKTKINKLHTSVLDFIILLEDILLETLEEQEIDSLSKDKLNKTIQKLNKNNIGLQTIWNSVHQTKMQFRNHDHTKNIDPKTPNPNGDIKKTLFSNLLENWKPKTSESVN